jgi:hypothetical protein
MPRARANAAVNTWNWRDVETAAYIYQTNVTDLYDEDELKHHPGVRLRAFQLIAQKLNRSLDLVCGRFASCGPSFAGIARGTTGSLHVPAQALADRDRRKEAAGLRDFTSTFFGDPPPGFSALDKRGR